ncbi:MAG: vWA domain-containing protein [Acidiferrobacterales bacterium]
MLALLISVWPMEAVAGGHGIDAVLTIDSSGSMKYSDPLKLRVPAAKLFVSLLGASDRVGVISFSDLGYPVIGLTPPWPIPDRSRLFSAIDKVSSRGAHTNLYDALRSAQRMLVQEGNPHRRRYIILMSDGKMDTGHKTLDDSLLRRIDTQLLPQLRKQGIRVYTIAFTASSDAALLENMARSTSGQFRLARTDADLHRVFTDIFESTKHPNMLVVKGGRFLVDSSVKEVTVVASKRGAGVKIVLQDPRGARYSAHTAPGSMRWFASTRFDMITIADPEPGHWAVLASSGGDKAYVLTDLKLMADSNIHGVLQGAEPVLRAWLTRAGQTVIQPQVLATTRMQVTVRQPGGATGRYPLHAPGPPSGEKPGDGIYSARVPLLKAGLDKITFIAKGRTFERETVRYVYVSPTPAPLPAALQPVAVLLPAAAPARPLPPAAARSVPAVVPPHAAPSPAAPARRSPSLWLVFGIFALFNLVSAGIIMLVMALRQPRASVQEASDEGDDDGDGEKG